MSPDGGQPPDVWHLLFVQLSPALRWLFGVVTLGLFSIAGILWARQERNVQRIEQQLHDRMDREMRHINERLAAIDRHLMEVAYNTATRHQWSDDD